MKILLAVLNERRAYDTRPLPDGRVLDVFPLLFGEAKLTISRDMEDDGAMNVWYYANPVVAWIAMQQWEPTSEPEPIGWYWHPMTRRYRAGGDPAHEHVGPME